MLVIASVGVLNATEHKLTNLYVKQHKLHFFFLNEIPAITQIVINEEIACIYR